MSISRCHSDLELEYFVALCSKCIALPPCLLNTLLKKMSTFDRFPLKSFWIGIKDDKRPDVNHNIHHCWLGSASSRNQGTNLEEILLEQMHLVGSNWQWNAAEELKLARKFILKIPGPIVVLTPSLWKNTTMMGLFSFHQGWRCAKVGGDGTWLGLKLMPRV